MSVHRKIPSTIATQHPDHAAQPFWHTKPYISAAHETQECFLSFSELGITEYKWDWEGKHVDEAVVERLLSRHTEYFSHTQLGKDKFLTFRLPNPKVETEYRLGRAFMGILSASSLAKHIGYTHNPLFEVILPMTETAEEMIAVQEAFAEVASLKHPLLKHESLPLKYVELIPLFEQIDVIASSAQILEQYVALHEKKFGRRPSYIRPYLARSDPALNSGLIPTVLSIKIALSAFQRFESKQEIPLFPMIGAAALPFRGGLTPHSVDAFIDEYRGVRTTTIQSAFKYDYPKTDVIQAIETLDTKLPHGKADTISAKDVRTLSTCMKTSEVYYQSTIAGIAPLVHDVAGHIPRRRERVQHVGLFGYSRGVGSVRLPRAIGFTAAMYSLGIPPEMIGTGRALKLAKQKGWVSHIEQYYRNMRDDLMRSGAFLNKKNLKKLANQHEAWQQIAEDVQEIETYFGETLGPRTHEEKEHMSHTSAVLEGVNKEDDVSTILEEAARLRHSMG